jgi:hypothetical protein
MARIMSKPTLAALAASLSIGLSGLSFSVPASAYPTCEAQMAHKCMQGDWWRTAGYSTEMECVDDQIAYWCPPFDHDGSAVAPRTSSLPDRG